MCPGDNCSVMENYTSLYKSFTFKASTRKQQFTRPDLDSRPVHYWEHPIRRTRLRHLQLRGHSWHHPLGAPSKSSRFPVHNRSAPVQKNAQWRVDILISLQVELYVVKSMNRGNKGSQIYVISISNVGDYDVIDEYAPRGDGSCLTQMHAKGDIINCVGDWNVKRICVEREL